MKLILLAAGKSSRIYNDIKLNKCLIKIKNKSLIRHIIDNAKECGIKKIDVVTGFKSKNIKKELKNYKINLINNNNYNNTDMVFSAILAIRKSRSDLIISYTDIIYEKKLFKKIIKKNKSEILVPYLKDWKRVWLKRNKNIYKDAETFIIKDKNKIIEIGKKITKKNIRSVNGQFMGLIYLPQKKIKTFLKEYKIYKKKKVQFTEFLNYLIKKNSIFGTEYKGLWYEFDDIEDVKLFKQKN